MLISNTELVTVIYILVMSCGTPLVYYLGIEENRKIAQEYFKSNMRIVKKKSREGAQIKVENTNGSEESNSNSNPSV